MKNLIKKTTSVCIAVTLILMSAITSFSAETTANEKVRVIIENNVFSVDDGATWDGVLVDQWVNIDDNSSMISSIVEALDDNGYTQEGAESNYITSINGLSAFDGGYASGWMGTLNDWFTNEGFGAYTVADGTLENGDIICFTYSLNYGEDVGSLWASNDTSLTNLAFSSGTLSPEFSSSTKEYTLTIPSNISSVEVNPTAYNKNFFVKTYKNEYTPTVKNSEYKRSEEIQISDGDKIYVGIGNSNWPSMNSGAEESVYTINIKVENIAGDVNADGVLNISDCTQIQKYMANLVQLTDEELIIADYNKDGNITILDVTAIQKNIVKIVK